MANRIYKRRILMVDDAPSNLRLLADLLGSHGYEVSEAPSGPVALKMIQANLPHLILLDIFMPGMDGYQVCQQLKADERTREIPVIFISALSDTDNIVKGFEVGGVDYIIKPFKFREVLARVENHLLLVQQRKEIEALRLQDHQSFEALNRMKDEFIRMATHDLRNPLNVILGYTEVVGRLDIAESHQPMRNDALQAIRQNIQKMRGLVTDILDVAQVETGTGLTFSTLSLKTFLEKCLADFYIVAQQKQIKLIFNAPDSSTEITVDEHYMTRVVDNLVSNAIKYTPSGGEVTISACADIDYATIEITDTGIGIAEDDLMHLFDAFYRASHVQHEDIEGSGLGLAIVKTIVEKHSGLITVKSEPGKGSTFSIRLPLQPIYS
ncbi:MAG: hybrid sensor histidine kinase/response regulator [Chloroflexi bacterium]|nr:hybrid sensor histidine kinase/response regulator [Chloroflexota bacterium]